MVVDVQEKMLRNLTKAIDEHRKTSKLIMTYDHYEGSAKKDSLVRLEIFSSEARGSRKTMEDAHSVHWVGEQVLVGLYDGHGGCRASNYANMACARQFERTLQESQGSPYKAFTKLFAEVHSWYLSDQRNPGGTTALLLYLDEEKQSVITATLGDSEAFLYRKIRGSYQALPLSCVRNWSSKADSQRAAIAYGEQEWEEKLKKAPNLKKVHVMVESKGAFHHLNVSRAIGDRQFAAVGENPLVIQKPKITEARFQDGDFIIAACDGVWDYLEHSKVIKEITALRPGESLAKRITLRALGVSKDNITIIALRVVSAL